MFQEVDQTREYIEQFNNRALVHSNQHGKGQIFDNLQKYSSKVFLIMTVQFLMRVAKRSTDIQLKINDAYRAV